MLEAFADYAQKQGVNKNAEQMKRSSGYLLAQIKALIGRNLYDNEAYFPVVLKDDKVFKAALEKLGEKQ
jgi:hypothetical protein